MSLASTTSHVNCTRCGSTKFVIDGYVGYRQAYESQSGQFKSPVLMPSEDRPVAAHCAACGENAFPEIAKVISFYQVEVS